MVIDSLFFFPYLNNRSNSCHLLTKLVADGLVVHSSLLHVYNLVPDILLQLFVLANGGGEAGMKEIDSVLKCAL